MRRPSQPILIYDGDCGLCRWAVARVRARDRHGTLECVPYQDARARELGIGLRELAAAAWLVWPDGRACSGADTIPVLGRLLSGAWWVSWVYAAPGVRGVARRVYGFIAQRRRRGPRGLPAAGGGR